MLRSRFGAFLPAGLQRLRLQNLGRPISARRRTQIDASLAAGDNPDAVTIFDNAAALAIPAAMAAEVAASLAAAPPGGPITFCDDEATSPVPAASRLLLAGAEQPAPQPAGPTGPPVPQQLQPQHPMRRRQAAHTLHVSAGDSAFGGRRYTTGPGWVRVYGIAGDGFDDAQAIGAAMDTLQQAAVHNAAVRAAYGTVMEGDGVREQVLMEKMGKAVKSSTAAAQAAFKVLKRAGDAAVKAAQMTSNFCSRRGKWACSSIMRNNGTGQPGHSDTGLWSAVVNLAEGKPLLLDPDASLPTWEV